MNKLSHIIKLGWAYKVTRTDKPSFPPFQYTIEPTNVCNLSCAFCPQSDPEHHRHRAHGKLSEENFELFLNRIKEADPGNNKINLTLDGEPFLNKNTVRFVELAAAAGFTTVFASNGTLLDRPLIDRLSAAGPVHLSIDFAAEEKVFESLRGQEGHFTVVLDNLLYLIDKARQNENVHLSINDIASFGGAEPEVSLRKLKALFDSPPPERVRFTSRQFHNFCGHLETAETNKNYRLCPYPWTQLAVTYSGDCVACCRDTAARTVLGNVFEKSIMEIWTGEPYRRMRRNLLNRKPELNAACADCDLPYSGGERRWKFKYIFNSLLGR
jgi:radical SAM protein with 4Fe4S-binding SPASM domain